MATAGVLLIAAAVVLAFTLGGRIDEVVRDVPLDEPLPVISAEVREPLAAEGPAPLCGGPPEMLILAVGADNYEGYERGLADVIRVVRVDFTEPHVAVLTLPRDLWVKIPDMTAEQQQAATDFFGHATHPETGETLHEAPGYARINSAYFYGNLYDVEGGGPGQLALTIYEEFGIAVDHYGVANMTVLSSFIDAVGGVQIEVAEGLDGFEPGWHTMDGETALAYARVRSSDNDFFRVQRQNQVLAALRVELVKPANLARIPALTNTFLDEAATDLTRSEITALACLMQQITPDEIESFNINGRMVTSTYTTNGAFVLLPNAEHIDPYVEEFLGED